MHPVTTSLAPSRRCSAMVSTVSTDSSRAASMKAHVFTTTRSATFEELQRAFVDRLGPGSVSDLEEGTIVVLPSATFALAELRKIIGIARYEERLLCMVL